MLDAFVPKVAHFPLTVNQSVIVGEVGDDSPVCQPHHVGKANC